jgi:hypothetical protein
MRQHEREGREHASILTSEMTMSVPGFVKLALHGLEGLNDKTRSEVIVDVRHAFEPLVRAAGKTLILTTGIHRGDLNLDFDTVSPGPKNCSRFELMGEGGTYIPVKAHSEMRVCGPILASGKQDARKFITTDWLLGRSLSNTVIHELGHFIADLSDVSDMSNYMGTFGPPKAKRTMATQREAWAGKKMFTDDQKQKLVKQLKEGIWLGDIGFH